LECPLTLNSLSCGLQDQRTPLHCASTEGVARLLLEAGADKEARDKVGGVESQIPQGGDREMDKLSNQVLYGRCWFTTPYHLYKRLFEYLLRRCQPHPTDSITQDLFQNILNIQSAA
jgi:hypothetical protein